MESSTQYRWQLPTKVVAIIDIVLNSLGLIATLITSVIFSIGIVLAAGQSKPVKCQVTPNSSIVEPELPEYTFLLMFAGVWGFAIIFIAMISFQIFASYGLLKSTENAISPSEARAKAKVWMIVSIVCLLISCFVSSLILTFWLVVPIEVIIRLTFMAIVWGFMKELGSNWTSQTC